MRFEILPRCINIQSHVASGDLSRSHDRVRQGLPNPLLKVPRPRFHTFTDCELRNWTVQLKVKAARPPLHHFQTAADVPSFWTGEVGEMEELVTAFQL